MALFIQKSSSKCLTEIKNNRKEKQQIKSREENTHTPTHTHTFARRPTQTHTFTPTHTLSCHYIDMAGSET